MVIHQIVVISGLFFFLISRGGGCMLLHRHKALFVIKSIIYLRYAPHISTIKIDVPPVVQSGIS